MCGLNLIPGIYMVEGGDRVLQAVLWLLHTWYGAQACIDTHLTKQINIIKCS